MKQTSIDAFDLLVLKTYSADACKPTLAFIHSFVHSFIQAISISPLPINYYSEALPTQHGYCSGISRRSVTGNCERRTCKGPYTRRLVRESNLHVRPCGRKASALPMRHPLPKH